MKKRFLLLLTATPVQNDMVELFNLITLLKPGQFGTERRFRDEYMQKGSDRVPANKEKLRGLLREVMVRNTRSAIDLKLPRRYATTVRREPSDAERGAYDAVSKLVRERRGDMPVGQAALLMREAGSSPFALRATLEKLAPALGQDAAPAFEAISSVGDSCKDAALVEILKQNPGDKKVVFAQYLKSLDHICGLCDVHGVRHARFSGGMTAAEKDEAIARFRGDIPVLVSSESGGEGRNMQFCNTIVNYDLPWNPMRIEQRIGRLHRIGQTRDVFVFNLSMRGSIEDHVLRILDEKINMFEMVIGEIEPILGALGEDAEFEDLIMDVWLRSAGSGEAGTGFDELGEKLASAKAVYLETRRLDDEIFGEDYES
jgi:SNF2 family DNA or RNA helicase